ncbi:MAG: hypothetical protein ACRD1Y_02250 [Terriglobales bacterium]
METAPLRHAFRSLRRAPGFAIPALLTLTLGLGAAIAIFSVAHAVLLQPLAYARSNRLVMRRERIPLFSTIPVPFSPPDIAAVRSAGAAFARMGAYEENQRSRFCRRGRGRPGGQRTR